MTPETLLLVLAMAIIGLVVLVALCRLNPFIALALVSLIAGLSAGMNPPEVAKAFAAGLGNVLGSTAMVIGLGAFLGKLSAESGGAERIANTIIHAGGKRWLPWTMALAAFVIGIPVFFAVGLVLLVPIVVTVARQTSTPILRLGLPLVAGLSVVHGLAPPHPGPIGAVEILKADLGQTIAYALLIGLPTTILAGPLFGSWLGRDAQVEPGHLAGQFAPRASGRSSPGFILALFTMLLPVLLMLLGTIGEIGLARDSGFRAWLSFLSNPLVAMLAASLFGWWSFGLARGLGSQRLLRLSEECLGPVAQILLVVGAGGGFSQVLIQGGVGGAMASMAARWHLAPLLLGWLAAALIRIATGSATVAITTAAGLLGPVAAATPGVNRELLVVAMGAGSLMLSHVNDGGFWLVKEYFNLSVTQTLKTWTVSDSMVSITALGLTLLLSLVV